MSISSSSLIIAVMMWCMLLVDLQFGNCSPSQIMSSIAWVFPSPTLLHPPRPTSLPRWLNFLQVLQSPFYMISGYFTRSGHPESGSEHSSKRRILNIFEAEITLLVKTGSFPWGTFLTCKALRCVNLGIWVYSYISIFSLVFWFFSATIHFIHVFIHQIFIEYLYTRTCSRWWGLSVKHNRHSPCLHEA